MMVKQYEQKTVSTKQKNKIRVDSDKHSEKARGKSNNNNSCRQPLLHGPRAFSRCLNSKQCPRDHQQHVLLLRQLEKILLCAQGEKLTLEQQENCGLSETSIQIELGCISEIVMKIKQLCTQEENYLQALQEATYF